MLGLQSLKRSDLDDLSHSPTLAPSSCDWAIGCIEIPCRLPPCHGSIVAWRINDIHCDHQGMKTRSMPSVQCRSQCRALEQGRNAIVHIDGFESSTCHDMDHGGRHLTESRRIQLRRGRLLNLDRDQPPIRSYSGIRRCNHLVHIRGRTAYDRPCVEEGRSRRAKTVTFRSS